MIHPTAKVSEGINRNMPARNTLEQLLAVYTNPESHNAQRYRQTDGRTDRRTDNRITPIADHTVQQYDRLIIIITRKLSYRKDDPAMRPIYS